LDVVDRDDHDDLGGGLQFRCVSDVLTMDLEDREESARREGETDLWPRKREAAMTL
jgi:hypothetical protein